jgi:hypothetical protein
MSSTLKPWLMLIIRSILFLAFQALIALVCWMAGSPDSWNASVAWWPIAVILTNLVCLVLLISLYQQQGQRFWDIFKIKQEYIKADAVFMLGFLLIAGPLGYFPNILSARWLFGDPQIALNFLVRPLPVWAAVTTFALFPLLQGLVEIPTYMRYALPRIEVQGLRPWTAVALASFFLSAQHIFAPFIPDARFITYRMVMFLPFAVLIALVMRARPRLMPYLAVIHVLMDLSVVGMLFDVAC